MHFIWSEQQQTRYEASVSFALGRVLDPGISAIQLRAAPRVLNIAYVLSA